MSQVPEEHLVHFSQVFDEIREMFPDVHQNTSNVVDREVVQEGHKDDGIHEDLQDNAPPQCQNEEFSEALTWLADIHAEEDFSNEVRSSFPDGHKRQTMGLVKPLLVKEIDQIPGLRVRPESSLLEASKGDEESPSAHNDKWAAKRVDALREALGWDMSVQLGDLPFGQLDELFSEFFQRVTKLDGSAYPSDSLMNLCNALNRILKKASMIRSLNGQEHTALPKDFHIKEHEAFVRTRLTLTTAIRKSAKDGVNKKRKKVETLTVAHEQAILADFDHQADRPHGCQKRFAFYCLIRFGLRGGKELYNLKRNDIRVEQDQQGKSYVIFEERLSKNNNYSLKRYNEEQFRKPLQSYEADVVFTANQYLRHMPVSDDCSTDDLFLCAITNPTTNVWYNKRYRVSEKTQGKWMKSMLAIVGMTPELFSNRTGRATLITRLATSGVPNEVGMIISGHRTVDGYLCYDRTQALRMEVAQLVSLGGHLKYEEALVSVTKKLSDEIADSGEKLNPLVKPVDKKDGSENCGTVLAVLSDKSLQMKSQKSPVGVKQDGFDCAEIDWEKEIFNNPSLAKYLGASSSRNVIQAASGSMVAPTLNNCTIQYITYSGGQKENDPPDLKK